MVSRGITARATSTARCGDSPVAGVFSALRPGRGIFWPLWRPSRRLRGRVPQPRQQQLEVADDFRIRRHEGIEARDRGERQHRKRVRPRLRLQLHRVEPDRDDEIGCVDEFALDQAADDTAGAQRMVLRDHALAFGGGEHGRAQPFGKFYELRRGLAPKHPEADQQHRLARLCQHVQRRLKIGAVRPRKY